MTEWFDHKRFSDDLARKRTQDGLTYRQLAGIICVDYVTLQRMETGTWFWTDGTDRFKTMLHVPNLMTVCYYLETTIEKYMPALITRLESRQYDWEWSIRQKQEVIREKRYETRETETGSGRRCR